METMKTTLTDDLRYDRLHHSNRYNPLYERLNFVTVFTKINLY